MEIDVNNYVFKGIYSDSHKAIIGLNLMLVLWNQFSGRKHGFGQFLENEFPKLVLPPYYYESSDSYEVFSYVCNLIESEFSE